MLQLVSFGLNSTAYISEIIRGGILGIDKGQSEAAMALGVPYRPMMIKYCFATSSKKYFAFINERVYYLNEGIGDCNDDWCYGYYASGLSSWMQINFVLLSRYYLAGVIYYLWSWC